ncbi:MAG: hypothetical protein ACRDSH_20175, partial [Pseudonocardiaceae bacterium]
VPVLGGWLIEKCSQAYHTGFVESLAHDPQQVILALTGKCSRGRANGSTGSAEVSRLSRDRANATTVR